MSKILVLEFNEICPPLLKGDELLAEAGLQDVAQQCAHPPQVLDEIRISRQDGAGQQVAESAEKLGRRIDHQIGSVRQGMLKRRAQ